MTVLEWEPSASDRTLETCGLFSGLSATQRTMIASLMTERRVEPGAILAREGDSATELLVILDGRLR